MQFATGAKLDADGGGDAAAARRRRHAGGGDAAVMQIYNRIIMSKYKTCFYISLIVFLIERKLICRHGKFTVSFATLQRSARFLRRDVL